MRNLALFDFDGTITSRDTFTPFILHAVEPLRMAIGKVVLSSLIVAYKLGFLSASRMRRSVVHVGLRGRRYEDVRVLGRDYARRALSLVVRPKALERIRWHQSHGDLVVVVSASLDVYLTDWCREVGVELICTELEQRLGVLTGRYRDGDCSGPEKARRVRQRYDLGSYGTIYAYGDTVEDEAMLALANQPFYRWRELHD
ncbi:MAG TPA: HAD family hydrolase [Polyangiaceae bacterium]|nr:HAD family hydrolase [Polyangiaceae bacterium]